MNIREFLKDNIVILDGAMGTLLQKEGLLPGEFPERWNITHKDAIVKIHKEYFDAGSNIVSTNTFGANLLKFSLDELEDIVSAAVRNARLAKETSGKGQEKFIALDIGPTGKLLKPYGDLDFEDAVKIFAETIKLGVKYGVDLIYIETMSDSYESKAAVLAAKENCDLPVFLSNAYGEDLKLMTGASPAAMVALAEGLGVDAIGANCSLGPRQLLGVVGELLKYASVPVIVKPNAGLPKSEEGKTVYDIDKEEFCDILGKMLDSGVKVAGGCCGTTPEYINLLSQRAKHVIPKPITDKNITCVSSYANCVRFSDKPVLIGERINPTGKKRLKQAILENDIDYILKEGISQQEKGVHVLDVNVGLPEIDEEKMLKNVVCELQSVINLPLQIDTADINAMESALRRYNGKAMINSVNGKEESMKAVFPLVKKYGGVVVALTLDENGIPKTAEERVKIAEKILGVAKSYGIEKKNIIFDTLAMTISADKSAAKTTLESLNIIKNKLMCHTSLGVSNVSFGLPKRDVVNSTFFALALENGLSAAIMNPHSQEMMKTYYSYCALSSLDENCTDYIEFCSSYEEAGDIQINKAIKTEKEEGKTQLQNAIIKGLKERSGELTALLLKENAPLDIVKNDIIPALDIVGKGFEEKKIYLPQLLMSAEAAKNAFEQIKKVFQNVKNAGKTKCTIVLATVKGDIHDIGKNIVKLMLENYGFNVIDLGKDVAPDEIVREAIEKNAPIVALSALMTTTVPAMEETIKLLRQKKPECRVIVGGAVMTKEYADLICADKYAKDAMGAVRYAEEIDRAF